MDLESVKKLNIPSVPGSYQFKDKTGRIIYIGKASGLRSRIYSYWRVSANHTAAKQAMMKRINKIEWIETESEIEALLLEANLIKKHQPYFNIDLRDDKRFAYIKISAEDEIPGVFITRQLDRAGKYFGPFTDMTAVKEVLKALRKIWPYCTERRRKEKPCFYYQINRCSGVCGGISSRNDYQEQIIKPIILFLSGKKKRIVNQLKNEIKVLEKKVELDEESIARLGRLRFKLLNMQKVLEHANIISVAEKYAADIVELAKVLSLPRAPERIEGYDISNIFGQEAVGSMVVFKEGEPDKNEYRKFRIKIGQGQANDVGMLREVLSRRFKRAVEGSRGQRGAEHDSREIENKINRKSEIPTRLPADLEGRDGGVNRKSKVWSIPDLIIIDGGKGQLNAVVRVVKKSGLDIPVIAVSKGKGLRSAQAPDKVFFPNEKMPLELPLASPALHIIKRVRDEAHRFAIKYHQLLRRKKVLKP